MKRTCLFILTLCLAAVGAQAQTITLTPTTAVTFASPDHANNNLTGYKAYVFDHLPGPPDFPAMATALATSGATTVAKAAATVVDAGAAVPVYKIPLSAFGLTIPACTSTTLCPSYWLVITPLGAAGEMKVPSEAAVETLSRAVIVAPAGVPAAIGPVHLVSQ